MNFNHPFFWRHFAAYTAGAVLVLVGLFGPHAAAAAGPFTGFMVLAGAGVLAVAGTRILGRPPEGPPAAAELEPSERPTPPSGPAQAA
jgi:hypothetical protein